jgi:hypothetical protein
VIILSVLRIGQNTADCRIQAIILQIGRDLPVSKVFVGNFEINGYTVEKNLSLTNGGNNEFQKF